MILLTAIALASASPGDKEFGVYAFPGNDSCANWTQNRANRGSRTQALEGWVLGYLTAYNAYVEPNGRVDPTVNATAALGWIDNYCREHPLDHILDATIKLIDEMLDRKS